MTDFLTRLCLVGAAVLFAALARDLERGSRVFLAPSFGGPTLLWRTAGCIWYNIRMKAIVPAAGHGTRFLPVTRVVPKEMLPIGSRPALEVIVEEAKGAGVVGLERVPR